MTVTSIGTQSSDWASQLLDTIRDRNNGKGDDLADKLMGDLDTDGDSVLSLRSPACPKAPSPRRTPTATARSAPRNWPTPWTRNAPR